MVRFPPLVTIDMGEWSEAYALRNSKNMERSRQVNEKDKQPTMRRGSDPRRISTAPMYRQEMDEPGYSESSSSSSSSLAVLSHSMNFSADLRTALLVLMSTYFLLALEPQALRTSSETRSFS